MNRLGSEGTVFLRYDDLRKARQAAVDLHNAQPDWHVSFIHCKEFLASCGVEKSARISDHDGHLYVTALWQGGPGSTFDDEYIAWLVTAHLLELGDIVNVEIVVSKSPVVGLHVEYFSVQTAAKVTKVIGKEGFHVSQLDVFSKRSRTNSSRTCVCQQQSSYLIAAKNPPSLVGPSSSSKMITASATP